MASKAPPVPRDQRSKGARGGSPASRDPETSRDPAGGDAHLNLKSQGRYANIHQNIVHQGRQQDR